MSTDDLDPRYSYDWPHPGRPHVLNFRISQIYPMDPDHPEGVCMVQTSSKFDTAEQAQKFRQAMQDMFMTRNGDG